MRVALVVMPFAAVDGPSLAAGLLQAGLRRQGFACDTKYFNVTFWRLLGSRTYDSLYRAGAMLSLPGEWIFSQAFYGQRLSDWQAYRREVLENPLWGQDRESWEAIRSARAAAPAFLRLALESNDWGRYDLVGFTSVFQQTMASLCLARAIRERYPRVRIALGGANFHDDMGRPFLEHFDFVDFVSTGEADHALPELCRSLRDQRPNGGELEVPPGFLYRRDGEVRGTPSPAGGVTDLENLPTPNYDDYFRVIRSTAGGSATGEPAPQQWLLAESSRGCWWGQKSHCTFCGLNGKTMAFRRKSWHRVVAETDELWRRYGELPLQFADNILSMDFFRDLLPFWAESRPHILKFFEIKANLRRGQVELLRRAGVRSVQPGIESLADGSLRRMGKGVSGAQNVALLRWCAELGIRPIWNVLYGFPDEEMEDYEHNHRVLEKLSHLPAPEGFGLIRVDRFSPNYTRWREQGFTALAPLPAYRHIFAFDDDGLRQAAYFFCYRHPQLQASLEAAVELSRHCDRWRRRSEQGTHGELALKPHWQDGFVLVDSRFNFERRHRRPSGSELALLFACDAPASRREVLRRAAADLPPAAAGSGNGDGNGNRDLEAVLDRLLAESLIAEVGKHLVTLALLPSPEQLAAAADRHGSTVELRRAR